MEDGVRDQRKILRAEVGRNAWIKSRMKDHPVQSRMPEAVDLAPHPFAVQRSIDGPESVKARGVRHDEGRNRVTSRAQLKPRVPECPVRGSPVDGYTHNRQNSSNFPR
jgi:hypothetical protein